MQRLMKKSSVPVPDPLYWEGLSEQAEDALPQKPGRNAVRLRPIRILTYAAAAACLVLLAGVAGWQRSRILGLTAEVAHLKASGDGSERDGYELGEMARFMKSVPQSAVAEQAEAFHVLDDYLQGSLRWVVQDGEQTELGMSGDLPASSAAAPGKPVLVEIQVMRIERGGEPRVISAPTLMIVPGQEANFRLAASDGSGPKKFRYRCATAESPTGKPHIAVTVELMLDGYAEPVRLSGVVKLGDGERVPAAYSRVGEVGYALFASVLQSSERTRVDLST
jgi:hypothetical protein